MIHYYYIAHWSKVFCHHSFPGLETEKKTLRIAAAALGRGSLVRELLKANADVDIPNQNGAAWTEPSFVEGSTIRMFFGGTVVFFWPTINHKWKTTDVTKEQTNKANLAG